jgi:hypothetical protein
MVQGDPTQLLEELNAACRRADVATATRLVREAGAPVNSTEMTIYTSSPLSAAVDSGSA